MITVPMSVSVLNISVPMEVNAAYRDYPEYTGPTEITPSGGHKIVYTASKFVKNNIIVNPIPSNYGRITYNNGVLKIV